MSTQDEEPLKLEPPHGQPPAAQPPSAQPPAVPDRAEAAERQPDAPAEQPAEPELRPGAGRPLVEGPPMSVDEPISDSTINRTAAFAGIGLLGIGAIVVVVVLVLVLLAICTHR